MIVPKNKEHWLELRTNDVTSTDVAAIFGISPYLTSFELWHRKKDKLIVSIEESERMRWGNRLETAIATGIAEDNSWKVAPLKCYIRDPDARIGSSFDFSIEGDPSGILEIKNVDARAFKNGWVLEGDTLEAPPHIELQVQHQLAISGKSFAYIGALVGGNTVALIRREPDAEIIDAIKTRVLEFWESIDKGKEPSPDFEKDSAFIISLNKHAEPGKILDGSDNAILDVLANEYLEATEAEKAAAKRKEEAKAKMMVLVGDAEKVIGNGFSISAGEVAPTVVSFERKGYRNFRINWRKNE